MKQHSKMQTYLRSGFSALYCTTHEEARTVQIIMKQCEEIKFSVWQWTATMGLVNPKGQIIEKYGDKKTSDPGIAMLYFLEMKKGNKDEPEGANIGNKSVLILKDFHLILKKGDPVMIRLMKDAISSGRLTARSILVMGCTLQLPPELEKEFTTVDFPLPTRDELKEVAEVLIESKRAQFKGDINAVADAGSGMTINEFADAAAASLTEHETIVPEFIASLKAHAIKKGGILELIEHRVTLDDIGGLDLLKADLHSKRRIFTKEAKEYGLPSPRALLLCGNPGTGKSLGAAATGGIFGIPIVRLEAGRLFGSLVGESEGNWRKAFTTAKAIAPIVFWIDEVDGLFIGANSSGDSGTTSRVVKGIIQDMQFNGDGMMFVFTANDIDNLPDPLIDRCDVWNVELPHLEERKAIWRIHIAKRKRNPDGFDLHKLAVLTEGFSGRQIEQAWIAAMTLAFNDNSREPSGEDVAAVLGGFVPTSVSMAEQIERRRQRLAGCAKLASTPPSNGKSTGAVKRQFA